MTERPNRKALTSALDIYRDAMRPFIVRHLRRVRGSTVEECVQIALQDYRYNQMMEQIDEGRTVEEAIDINDFPKLVSHFWREVFRNAFKTDSETRNALYTIAEARNKVSHPNRQDIELEYAVDRLNDIKLVLKDINEPEQSRAVEGIRSALMPFSTLAHKFRQGGRDVYAFALDLETLDKLLPDRVDESVVKDANRPFTASHAKKIQKYLEERDDWLLGTLLLGISLDALEFHSYTGESNGDFSVGELCISIDHIPSMKMFDGQHRRRAIKEALKELSLNRRYSKGLSTLKEASVPIMVFAEDNIEALRQMFADAAHTRPIEKNTVTRFDQTDAFNLAALRIEEESELFAGRVEMDRSSVLRSSENIIAINQLAMSLRTVEVGYGGRVSKNKNDEYVLSIESLYDRCLTWADDFLPAARSEYNDLMAGEIDNTDIPQRRVETMAFNATVIRILAGCYHEWRKESDDWRPLADFLQGASLKPGVEQGSLLVDIGVVAPGGTSPIAQRQGVVHAIDYIVQKARESSA